MVDLVLFHGVEYDVAEPVTVEDLVRSLEANARLLRRSTDLLTELFPGLKFEPGKVSVRSLSQESPLKELFALALVVAYQKELEAEVPTLIESLTGIHVSDQYDTLVTIIVVMIALHGIEKAFDALFPGKDKAAVTVTKEGLIERVSKITGVAAERIRDALTVLFTGRLHRATVLASQKVFAPTRGQPNVTIKGRDGSVLAPANAVVVAQSAAGIPYEAPEGEDKPKKDLKFHRNVKIVLHAMDRDKKKTGWAGHVPGLFEARIPMDLEKAQSPDALFGKSEVNGDILLTMEEDENGEMQPKEFLLVQSYLD